MREKEYLGDGLYASFDGFQFELETERQNGRHWVALDTAVVMPAFLRYVEKVCGVSIKIKPKENTGE